MLVLTDVGAKMFWEFPLMTRIGDEVMGWMRHWVENIFPTYPGNHQLLHYHANGGPELIDQKLKTFLLKTFGTTVTWSSTDTPELNAIREEVQNSRRGDAGNACRFRFT